MDCPDILGRPRTVKLHGSPSVAFPDFGSRCPSVGLSATQMRFLRIWDRIWGCLGVLLGSWGAFAGPLQLATGAFCAAQQNHVWYEVSLLPEKKKKTRHVPSSSASTIEWNTGTRRARGRKCSRAAWALPSSFVHSAEGNRAFWASVVDAKHGADEAAPRLHPKDSYLDVVFSRINRWLRSHGWYDKSIPPLTQHMLSWGQCRNDWQSPRNTERMVQKSGVFILLGSSKRIGIDAKRICSVLISTPQASGQGNPVAQGQS